MKIIVFLGNPGDRYKQTRHNTARLFCASLKLDGNWSEKFSGKIIKNGDIIYFCPETYMNESGTAVQQVASFYNVKPENVIVVHDDIELKFGEIRIQTGGGMGGHNGLRSVKQHLGTENFSRLRIGIGRPPEKMDVASFVLAGFTEAEKQSLSEIFEEAKTKLENFI